MQRQIQKYITDNQLFTQEDKLLVAVSGGVDSMVLAILLKELNYSLGIAHCNFQLRGVESDEDARFVKEFAAYHEIPFYAQQFDTKNFAAQHKIGIQEAARQLRYTWFETLLKEYQYDKIVVAHHANDSIETALFNFAKGTGLRGLRGILPIKGAIVRPFLWAKKDDILNFAIKNNIFFREDSSNLTDDYTRNFIRHNIIPDFKQINPDFDNTALANINRFKEYTDLLDFFIQNIKNNITQNIDNQFFIDIKKIKSYPSVKTVLFELLKDYGFNNTHIEDIVNENTTGQKIGTKYYSDTHCLLIDRDFFILKTINKGFSTEGGIVLIEKNQKLVDFPMGQLSIDYSDIPPFDILKNKNFAQLDADKLSFPLKLRPWKIGDKFHPFGMKGKSQLLSDFFRSRKISSFDKEKIYVLTTDNDEVVWIIGWRMDDRFKLTERSEVCLKVVFE